MLFTHRLMIFTLIFILSTLLLTSLAYANESDVVAVKAKRSGQNVYRFDVTVQHADTGWDHYANKWEVLAPDGSVLGTRILHHPHVGEQPFTRSLSGVEIPTDIKQVIIRSYDSVHEGGGKEISVDLSTVD